MSLHVRHAEAADRERVAAFLAARNAGQVARLGELLDAAEHPALVADDESGLAGVLTYVLDGEACEILTLHAARAWQGAGTALIQAAERVARDRGCRRLWLLTTNDNVDALRFYQRRGFRLAELHCGGVDRCRDALKPEIPRAGAHGIPLHDELVLDKQL